MEECKHKKTLRGEDEKKLIINRLSRIEGQLAGIKRMVEKDTYCICCSITGAAGILDHSLYMF